MTARARPTARALLAALPLALALAVGLPATARAAPPAEETEIQLYDRIVLRANPTEPIEGKVIEEKRDGVTFLRRNSKVPYIIARSEIERIEYAEAPDHAYRERAKRIAEGDVEARLELVRFCLRFGLEREAEAEAEKALRADPRCVEAYRQLHIVFRARYGKVDPKVHADVRERELAVYERADRAGALPPDLRLRLARLMREAGAREAALDQLLRLESALEGLAAAGPASGAPSASTLSAAPLDAASFAREARLELGNLALEVGRAEVAARTFAALAGASPDDAGATIGAGLAAFARGDLAAAARHFERAAELQPSGAHPLVLRAAVAVHEGDLALAERMLDRALALGVPLPQEGSLAGAVAAALAGKLVTARERLARVEPAPPFAGEVALVEGLIAEIASSTSSAVAAFDRAAESDAAAVGIARVARAQSLLARGERAAAEESLKEAARAGYDFAEVAAMLSRSRREAGDHATAVRYARYAADARPDDADKQYALGLSYLGAGKPDDAEAAFDAALARAPDHAHALAGKGRVLYGRGDWAAAKALFRRALTAEPDLSYAGLALRRLEEAETRRLWRDDFERPDGKDVRNRWLEDERFGIEAGLRGGRLVLAGTQASEEMGRTSIVRDVDGLRFAEFRARLDPGGQGRARAGVRLAVREGEVVLFRSPEGRIAFAARTGAAWSEPRDLGAWPAARGARSLWISIGGPQRDEVVFGIDEEELARVKQSAFGRANAFSCALYVQAPVGAAVEVAVDEALVFVAREQRKTAGGGY